MISPSAVRAIGRTIPAFRRLGEMAREGAVAMSRFAAAMSAEPTGFLRIVNGVVLPDNRPLYEWAADFERTRFLARDDVMRSQPTPGVDPERVAFVSTVFLGQDIMGGGPFETLISHGDWSDVVERYPTMGDALRGHANHLERVVRVCAVEAEDDARVFARRCLGPPRTDAPHRPPPAVDYSVIGRAGPGFPSIPVQRSDRLDALAYSQASRRIAPRPPPPTPHLPRDDYEVGFRANTASEVDELRERHGGGARQETLQNREHFAPRGELPPGAREAPNVVNRIDAVLLDQEIRSINPHEQREESSRPPPSRDRVVRGTRIPRETDEEIRRRGMTWWEPRRLDTRVTSLGQSVHQSDAGRDGIPMPMRPPVVTVLDEPVSVDVGTGELNATVRTHDERTPWGGYDPSQLEPELATGRRVFCRSMDDSRAQIVVYFVDIEGCRYVERVHENDLVEIDRHLGECLGWIPPRGVEAVGPFREIGRANRTIVSFARSLSLDEVERRLYTSGLGDAPQRRLANENEPAAAPPVRRTPEVRDEEEN